MRAAAYSRTPDRIRRLLRRWPVLAVISRVIGPQSSPLPNDPRKFLSHKQQVDVRFHLLYAGLPVERQLPVTV